MNIFKNPSSIDLDFIEELMIKYHLEDAFLSYLKEEHRVLILTAKTLTEKRIIKSLLSQYFPYTQKIWKVIFLLINQKITIDQLSQTIQEQTNLPPEVCQSLSQDISSNQTIQQEIIDIQIKEDIPDPEEHPYEETNTAEESVDEEFIIKIENEISKNENEPPKKSGGLGQELF